jgi:tetratricopeptide (TPR) repeat protein
VSAARKGSKRAARRRGDRPVAPTNAAAPQPQPPVTITSVTDRPSSRRSLHPWLCVALLLATAAVYAPVRHFGFLNYDDEEYVTENAHVTAGLTRDGFVWAWTGVHQATWHPLTTLSHMLDCQLFGLNAGPHHLGNVVLHALNTLLLFGLLARLTAQPWRSAWVAALFALHPLHVESVAWVSERKDVLSTFFWLLALWAYAAYAQRGGWRAYTGLIVTYIAALLSKPMAVTLPFVLLLLDLWPLRRITLPDINQGGATGRSPLRSGQSSLTHGSTLTTLLIEKVPLLLLAALVSVITYLTQTTAGAVVSLEALPLGVRVENAIVVYVAYLGKMLWPAGLAVFYPFAAPVPAWQVFGAALFLIAGSVVVLQSTRRRPYLFTGWFWYLGMLVPVIGLVHQGDQSMADRFTYVPLVGIFIMAAWGIPDLLGGWRHRQLFCAVAGSGVLVACTLATARQVRLWKDSLTLFEHALAVTRNNHVAHFIIGSALQEQGRRDEAFPHLAESLRLQPNYDKPNFDIGLIYAARGDLASARHYYEQALQLNPLYTKAHVSLGLVLAAQGDPDGALAHYREAIRIDPGLAAAHNNLAITLENTGKLDEAIAEYAEGVRLEPKHAESRCNLAAALASAGRLPEAVEQFRIALQDAPQLVEARFGLATAYAQAGQTHAAIVALEEALHERPHWTSVEATLAWLLATADDAHLRDGARAVQVAEAAAQRTNHQDATVLNSLAAAYAEVGRFSDAVDAASQALTLAHGSHQTALENALTSRLALYRTGQPVREPARGAHE